MSKPGRELVWGLGLVVVIVLLAVCMAPHAWGQGLERVTLANVCVGYTLSARGEDVYVRCPATPPPGPPWLRVVGCARGGTPVVDRSVAGRVVITCRYV